MDICWKAEVSKNVGGSLSILRDLIVSYKTHGMPQGIRGRAEGTLHLSPLQDGMVRIAHSIFLQKLSSSNFLNQADSGFTLLCAQSVRTVSIFLCEELKKGVVCRCRGKI